MNAIRQMLVSDLVRRKRLGLTKQLTPAQWAYHALEWLDGWVATYPPSNPEHPSAIQHAQNDLDLAEGMPKLIDAVRAAVAAAPAGLSTAAAQFAIGAPNGADLHHEWRTVRLKFEATSLWAQSPGRASIAYFLSRSLTIAGKGLALEILCALWDFGAHEPDLEPKEGAAISYGVGDDVIVPVAPQTLDALISDISLAFRTIPAPSEVQKWTELGYHLAREALSAALMIADPISDHDARLGMRANMGTLDYSWAKPELKKAAVAHRIQLDPFGSLQHWLALLGVAVATKNIGGRIYWQNNAPMLGLHAELSQSLVAHTLSEACRKAGERLTFSADGKKNVQDIAILESMMYQKQNPDLGSVFSVIEQPEFGRVLPSPYVLIHGAGHQHFLARMEACLRGAVDDIRIDGERMSPNKRRSAEQIVGDLIAPPSDPHEPVRPIHDAPFGCRWHPSELQSYALSASSPSKAGARPINVAAQRLAYLGLLALSPKLVWRHTMPMMMWPGARFFSDIGRPRPDVIAEFRWPVAWQGGKSAGELVAMLHPERVWLPSLRRPREDGMLWMQCVAQQRGRMATVLPPAPVPAPPCAAIEEGIA